PGSRPRRASAYARPSPPPQRSPRLCCSRASTQPPSRLPTQTDAVAKGQAVPGLMPRDAIRAARAAPQPAAAAAPSAKAARTDTGADRQMVFADIKTRLPALSVCGEARCVARMDVLL